MLYHIYYDEEESEKPKTLMEELTELVSLNKTCKEESNNEADPQQEESTITLTEITYDKKKKKKKKNKKNKNRLGDYMPLGSDPIIVKTKDGSLEEIDLPDSAFFNEYYDNEDDDDDDRFVNKIVDPNRSAYKKLKKDKNKYKRELAEEITLMYDTLKEVSKFSKKVSRRYDELEGNKTRGLSKYTVDLAQTVLSSKQAMSSMIKEIANIKKYAMDLEMKYDAQMAKLEKESQKDQINYDTYGSGYLQSLIEQGRKNVSDAVKGDYDDLYIGDTESSYDEDDDGDNDTSFDGRDIEDLHQVELDASADYDTIIADRLNQAKSDNSYFRSDEGDKYIRYEKRNPVIKIRYDTKNDDYDFFAIDDDGEIIEDYPVPESDRVHNPINFSQDLKYATDKFGRQYTVVKY